MSDEFSDDKSEKIEAFSRKSDSEGAQDIVDNIGDKRALLS